MDTDRITNPNPVRSHMTQSALGQAFFACRFVRLRVLGWLVETHTALDTFDQCLAGRPNTAEHDKENYQNDKYGDPNNPLNSLVIFSEKLPTYCLHLAERCHVRTLHMTEIARGVDLLPLVALA